MDLGVCRVLRRGWSPRARAHGIPGCQFGNVTRTLSSPTALGHTGQLAAVGHLPEADPAQAELAVDRVGTAAALAAGVAANLELRLLVRLVDQSGLGHVSSP